MKRIILFFVFLSVSSLNLFSQYIEEFDYDQPSTDAAEFIDIFIPTGMSPDDFQVILYNGNTPGSATSYNTLNVNSFSANSVMGGTIYTWDPTGNDNIQNGNNDGICLYNLTTMTVVQFISYEGVCTASNGPASGLTSTDVGVSENNNSPNLSIQYINSTWITASPNITILDVELIEMILEKINKITKISFSTSSEINSSHFIIEWSRDAKEWNEIGTVKAGGTTHDIKEYTFIHENPKAGINYYRLTQVDFDGRKETFPVKSVYFGSNQRNFDIIPNLAFNNVKIEFEKPVENGRLHIYNIDGQLMQSYVLASGIDVLRIDVSELPTGQYIAKYIDGEDTINRKFIKQ